MTAFPHYWRNETSGVLQPAVMAYLEGGEMTAGQISALRAYLRQWIAAPVWHGPEVHELREGIDRLTSREAIGNWLAIAVERGIDPL